MMGHTNVSNKKGVVENEGVRFRATAQFPNPDLVVRFNQNFVHNN